MNTCPSSSSIALRKRTSSDYLPSFKKTCDKRIEPSTHFAFFLGSHLQIGKFRKFRQPLQLNGTSRTISLFSDDNLGNPLTIGIFVVIFVSVNEHHHIGILLDSSGFSKVRKHRPLVISLFHRTTQLGKCNNRAVNFTGKSL